MGRYRVILLSIILSACVHKTKDMGYIADTAFKSSGEGNSPEMLVFLEEIPCLDAQHNPGLCTIRHKADKDLQVSILKRPYKYTLNIACSPHVRFDLKIDVDKEVSGKVIIPFKNFNTAKSFICIGEIIPLDRIGDSSAKFEFRIKVVEDDYIPRERATMFKRDGEIFLNVGKYAKYTLVFDNGGWKSYEKKAIIEVEDPSYVIAISESENMRFNHFLP